MIHKYKMNGYNIVVDVNGGAVHVLDDISYDVPDFYKDFTIEEIVEKLSNYPEENIKESYDELKSLAEEGLLFSDDDYINIEAFKRRDPVLKAMCLHVVHDCNLKCKYCFASQGDLGGFKAYMTPEVGKKALKYLVDNSGARKYLEVDFFGGEPLMDFDLIKELVEYGDKIAEEKNKKFRFTVTTNGVLLDDEKIEYINEHIHSVAVSRDGRKEVYNKVHMTVKEKGSNDIITAKFPQ